MEANDARANLGQTVVSKKLISLTAAGTKINMTVCRDGLEIYWALPAGVRNPPLSLCVCVCVCASLDPRSWSVCVCVSVNVCDLIVGCWRFFISVFPYLRCIEQIGSMLGHPQVTAVGFETKPLRTGALSQRLRPLGQTVLNS